MAENPPVPTPIQRRGQKQGPLSFSQESMWFLQQLDPENNAYNMRSFLQFKGGVDPALLERALNELFRRHETFRTLYPNQRGQPVQVIQPFKPFTLNYLDYSRLVEGEQQQAIHMYASEHGNQPYDLQRGPLVRFALLHKSPDEDYLFFSCHHIGSDAWSRAIILSEVIQLYDAFKSGEAPILHELPIQYADYAFWQREWLSGERLTAYIEHWKNILHGELPILDLPTDHPRPAMQTYRGARYYFGIQPAILSRVKKFCQKERLTPFHFFLAAYAIFLMRYTGQEDIIIGCPFANRSRPELDGLVGLFVNTLPIRLNLSDNPSGRELMNNVRTVMLDAFAWQSAPFEALVSEISPERDLSRTPVFQVTINLRNVPKRQTIIRGLEVENIPTEDAPAPFDISLEFDDEGDSLMASLQYNLDLFDENTIIHMAAHYLNILGELLEKSDRPIAELEMLTPSEQRRFVSEWNDTTAEYPAKHCLHELIESQVEKTPNAPAVGFNGQIMSYLELNRRANQLAHILRGLGVGTETLVALYVGRSIEMVVGLLAILKAGGAYVPIDPDNPLERRAFILEDSAAPVLLTLRHMVRDLPESKAQVVCIDSDEVIFTTQSDENLPNLASPENLAYVIYTSGSTGIPNGVMATHRNVVRLFEATQSWFRFNSRDVWTMFHSYAFDFSVWEIWGALIYGGRIVIVPYLVSRSPETFHQLVEKEGVTILNQTPSAFYQFIRADETAGISSHLKLRLIIFGGEALDGQKLLPWIKRHGDLQPQLINMYGITETTVHVTYCPILTHDLTINTGSMIGRPIPDLQIYLLDTHQNLCPIGVPGEIYVGGEGLARGYLHRDSLTAERFIENPFRPGKRLYKSGDLARLHTNGDFEYLGRVDFQVKLRGFRVELGEIEFVLEEHPGVRQAVVLMREDRPGDKRLVSYIVPIPGETLNQDQLRNYLKDRIPTYMFPSAFIFLESFPLTVNGKIDRHALPPPETDKVEEHYLAPRNDIEKRLVFIWKEVLDAEQIGIRDNFFELGGHSLLAVRLFSRIQDEFGQSLPLLLLFKEGTVEALATALRGQLALLPPPEVSIPVQEEGTRPPFFCISPTVIDIVTYHDLSRALGPDQPFYALYAPHPREQRITNPPDAVASFLDAVRRIQPSGPYYLGGYSSGGRLAIQLAHRLVAQGERVGLVVLLDSYAPNYPELLPWITPGVFNFLRVLRRVQSYLWKFWILDWKGKRDLLLSREQSFPARFKMWSDKRIQELHRPFRDRVKQAISADEDLEYRDCSSKVVLLRAHQGVLGTRQNPTQGWENWLHCPLEVKVVPGDHETILFGPRIPGVASILKNYLERTYQDQAGFGEDSYKVK